MPSTLQAPSALRLDDGFDLKVRLRSPLRSPDRMADRAALALWSAM